MLEKVKDVVGAACDVTSTAQPITDSRTSCTDEYVIPADVFNRLVLSLDAIRTEGCKNDN